jgi:hypothetical protein
MLALRWWELKMARTSSAINGREDDGNTLHTNRVKLPPKKETGE